MAADESSSDPGVVVAREDRHRLHVAMAAVAAGLLLLIGGLVTSIAVSDVPKVTVLDAFADAAGKPPSSGGLQTAPALYLHDHAAVLTLGALATALGGLLAAAVLAYLFLAVRARKDRMGQGALVTLAIGGVAYFIGTLVRQIAHVVSLSSFADGTDRSTAAAHDAIEPSAYLAGSLIQVLGQIGLAIAFIMITLNAMRVGLLTRFMGVLGILSGALLILQVAALPVVQAFWLMALGAVIAGRWPGGVPPAWTSGKAEPWPSRQQLLEAKIAAREARSE